MRKRLFITIIMIAILVIAVSSCATKTPVDGVIELIESAQTKLFNASSPEEIEEIQYDLLSQITAHLDAKHNGYRFIEGGEEYNNVMKCLDRYNIIYCRTLSRFNPDLDTNHGDEDKIVRVLTIMKKMENSALTKPEGFNPNGKVETLPDTSNKSVFPTQEEINSVNQELPVLVSDGTLNTKVEYDDRTKVQTFYYRFTQEVDESQITNGLINQLKANMVSALKKDANNVRRLQAGMSLLYVYYSVDNRRLYEININSNDLKGE